MWIIASGSTLNYVRRDFFKDKVTVVVNEAMRDFPTTYAFAHHRESAQEAIERGLTVISSEYCRCDRGDGLNNLVGDWYQYKHPQQPVWLVMDMKPLERDLDDTLVVGSNTVTSAMDFAGRILGASDIMLCGVDSGFLDNRINYTGYNGGGPDVEWLEQQTKGGTGRPHIKAQVSLIQTVADALRKKRIGVYSLNPFVDLGLEGHDYAR